MKRTIAVLVLLAVSLAFAHAADYRSGDVVRVEEGDTLNEDLFGGARMVRVYGVVQGDVYGGCESLTIDGEVRDDVLAGCSDLEINGRVGDGVIAFCRRLVIDGEVSGDVLGFGEEIVITSRARIGGNVFIGAARFIFEGGSIGGTIRGGAGEVYLNGTVGDQVDLEAGKVRFGDSYRPAGVTKLKLPYEMTSENTDNIPQRLEVELREEKGFLASGNILWLLWLLASGFLVGAILLVFFKARAGDFLDYSARNLWRNLGIGFIALVGAPVAAAILLAMVITIPLAFILLAAYLILMYLGFVFSALCVGEYLLDAISGSGAANRLFLSLLTGLIVVLLVTEVPIIGGLIMLGLILFGMGSFVNYIRGHSWTPNGTA